MKHENRRDDRYPVALEIVVTGPNGAVHGTTVNLSLGGVRVRAGGDVPRPASTVRTTITFPTSAGTEGHARVVWSAGQECGLAFVGPAHPKLRAFTHLAARHAAAR